MPSTPPRLHLGALGPALAALAAVTMSASPILAAPPGSGPTLQAPGELLVSSTTDGATLTIDGKLIGELPLDDSIILMPGEHTLRIAKRGYRTFTGKVSIKPGESLDFEMDLLPFAGIVRIRANVDGATVKVDGKVEGVTPFDRDIPAGNRMLTISHPGYDDEVQALKLVAAQEYDLNITLTPGATAKTGDSEFYETWWFWTIVGGVAAGTTAAAVVGSSGGEARPLSASFALQVP